MTIKEALVASISFSATDMQIEKSFIDAGINGSDAYTGDKTALEGVEYELLSTLLAAPDFSEGSFSIKQNIAGIKDRMLFLAKRLDKENDLPFEVKKAPKIKPANIM